MAKGGRKPRGREAAGEAPERGPDAGVPVPERCDCGAPWVFRAPWWDAPGADPEWGYLVHCERRHFRWYPAGLEAEELAAARERFGLPGRAGDELEE